MSKRKLNILESWVIKKGKDSSAQPGPTINLASDETESEIPAIPVPANQLEGQTETENEGMPQENVVKPDQTVGQNDDPSACSSVSEGSNGFDSSEKILLEPKSVQSPEDSVDEGQNGEGFSEDNTISLGPYHPRHVPHQIINNRRFNFQLSWYKQFPWIHYDNTIQKIVCFTCSQARTKGLFPQDMKYEETFIVTGYENWKHGLQNLKRHQSSKHHQEATSKSISSIEAPIVKTLCSSTLKKQQEAREALKAIFTSVMYLARQGLAIRGDENDSGNFITLLNLRATDLESLKLWLRRPKPLTSWDIQNEILGVVSHHIQRHVIEQIKSDVFFSLIVDETTDLSVQEQVSISVRTVNSDLEPEEYFLGLYETTSTTGEALSNIIIDCLMRLGLSLDNLRGQCYDGARNMSGGFRGVQSRILAKQPKALYVHCFNHSLNLALQDASSKLPFFRDILNDVNQIGMILRASPKRMGEFSSILASLDSSSTVLKPRLLCPTRWTMRVKAIESILSGYEILLTLMENLSSSSEKIASSASGLLMKLQKGEFYLGLLMAKNIFSSAELLSKVLQNQSSTISGGMEAARKTILSLETLKTSSRFESLWKEMQARIDEWSLEEPHLPRKRGKPKRFQDANETVTVFDNPKDRLQCIYFNAIDLLCEEITHRFDQPGLKIYEQLESILTCVGKTSNFEGIQDVCDFYSWEAEKLTSELRVLKNVPEMQWKTVKEIVKSFKMLKKECRLLFPGFEECLKHLLVMPCSSAGAERSFSRLRRIKSYMRTTMGQARLNHCCIINCYSDLIDKLIINAMLQEFVEHRNREATFGNFVV